MGKRRARQQELLLLSTDAIRPNPMQPRQTFDDAPLLELAESIRRHGILQPLTVRRTPGGWQLIAGERRLRAAKLAGLARVPCIAAEADDRDSAVLALVENLQRQDLHFLEESEALAQLLADGTLSREEAAALLGISPSALANKLRLRRLSPECAALVRSGGLSERHARALLRLEDPDAQTAAVRYVLARSLTVAETERYIDRLLAAAQTTPAAARRTYVIKDVRLFLNSVDRGLKLIRSAGVDAKSCREDTDDTIVLTLRIPKRPCRKAEL